MIFVFFWFGLVKRKDVGNASRRVGVSEYLRGLELKS